MFSRSARRWNLPLAIVAMFALAITVPVAFGQTKVVKRVTITVKCSVTRGASVSPCLGTFRITGDFKDSGRIFDSKSNDPAGTGATFKGVLRGKKGHITISDGGVVLAHKRRSCSFAAVFDVRGNTADYEGFRGTGSSYCTKVKVSGGKITRTDTFKVKLEKRT